MSSFIYAAEKAENKQALPAKLSLRSYYHPVTDAAIIAELLTIDDKEKRLEYAQEKVREEMVALAKNGLPIPNHQQIFKNLCSKWGILSQLVKPMPE
jgi:hypothetical protein